MSKHHGRATRPVRDPLDVLVAKIRGCRRPHGKRKTFHPEDVRKLLEALGR